MAIPATKDELLAAISERFTKLNLALDAVPIEHADDLSMEGHARGTSMSVNNLLSYLIGWNVLVLKWLDQDDRGQEVCFPEVGFKWNELGALAQKFYEDYAENSFEENRRLLVKINERLTAEIAKRSDEELYGADWYRDWTKGRMIQLNSSSPYENAKRRIRVWLKSQSV